MDLSLYPDVSHLLGRVIHRFFNLRKGTPIKSSRIDLGEKRHILDRLNGEEYLRVMGSVYIPMFRLINEVDAQTSRLGFEVVNAGLTAVKNFYKREQKETLTLDELLAEVGRRDLGLDRNYMHPGVVLADEFGFFSGIAMQWREGEEFNVASVTLNEKILDFKSAENTWGKIIAAREAARAQAASLRGRTVDSWEELFAEASGEDSLQLAEPPDFKFMKSADLREIVERDYAELQQVQHGVKSRMILAGGLIEALLLDALLGDETRARGCANASPKSLDEWSLATLIDVAVDLGLISEGPKQHGHAVRDFRNLVHPGKEMRGDYIVGEHEAHAAEVTLRMVIRDLLSRNKKASS